MHTRAAVDNSKKRTKKASSFSFNWNQHHIQKRRLNEQKQAAEKQLLINFQKMKHFHSIGNAFLVFTTNPVLFNENKLKLSGNEISLEDQKKIKRQDFPEDIPESFVSHLKELQIICEDNQIEASFSTVSGYGLICGNEKFLEEPLVLSFPREEELTDIPVESLEWGRCWENENGERYWTFGFSGILNHSCSEHASLSVGFSIYKDETITVFHRKNREDCILT